MTKSLNKTAARRCYHIALGVPEALADSKNFSVIVDDLEQAVTRLTGGITLFTSRGTWAQNAQEDDFSGEIERDFVINILVTMTVADHEAVWPKIVQTIRASVLLHALPVQLVHAMGWEAESLIFQIRQDEIQFAGLMGGTGDELYI